MRWSHDETTAEIDATAQAMKNLGFGKLEQPWGQ
jgi:hypothetical protein